VSGLSAPGIRFSPDIVDLEGMREKSGRKFLQLHGQETNAMARSKSTWLAISAAALGVAVGVTGSAIAFSELGMPMYMKSGAGADLATLANNEGVFVDKGSFKLRIGSAKGEPMPQITKMGGKEVVNGAIIVRTGDKLYIVDGKPSD
jgi:hypothetical protein